MKMIKQHIIPQLNSFTNVALISINNIFSEIQNESKTEFTEIICYIERLLNLGFLSTNQGLTSLHIHIENEFDDSQKLLIGEFLSIKLFKYYYSIDNQLDEANLSLADFITQIESKINSLEIKCPDGASGKKGGNRIWKNWVKEIKENKILLDFYRALNNNSSLKPKSIFNLQKNFCSSLSQKFEFRPYTKSVDDNRESYNLVNTTRTLNEIDESNNQLIDELDSIILFDCERKRIMTNFSFEEINKWNTEYNTRFTKYLIVTFGKDFSSINHTKNKLELFRERFKIPTNTTYTIAKSEIDFLLNKQENAQLSIDFVGYESSSFWDTFVLETSIRELYELRSIKLMNIYSICYTDEIKNYIIDELFSEKESSELISSATKLAILELRDDDTDVLKEALSNTLDVIMNSGIKSKVSDLLSNNPTIILDETILRNLNLLSKVRNCLGFTKTSKFKTWADLTNSDLKYLVILSYRDQGKYPNYYYPSLLELNLDFECNARAILSSFLFKQYYNWSKYNLYKECHKLLTHPIREEHFEWNKLKNKIQELKPDQKLYIDWNLENEYSNSDQREIFKIKLNNQRSKTYHSSDFIIFSEVNSDKLRIERVKWFYENIDSEDSRYKIQKLDELLDEFNPAERLIDTTQQEKELDIIRKDLGLENETAARIWKILLRKKADNIGVHSLYEELQTLFIINNIPLVRKSYFVDSWLNFGTTSLMPRGNKVVKVLFDYLNLNISYRLILYRLKNASVSGKIEATKKYSRLLKDLFHDGFFDEKAPLKSIIESRIQYYKNNYSLEELGIDNESPFIGLMTLIQLIQPELRLTELETIERITNE
jgi:hypothetical protein